MSFRRCQTFYNGSFSPIFMIQMIKDKATGSLVPKLLCSSESKLPDSDLFELENLLDAKIPLQQVNSRLVGGVSVDLEALAKAKTLKSAKTAETTTTTTTNNNGVENE